MHLYFKSTCYHVHFQNTILSKEQLSFKTNKQKKSATNFPEKGPLPTVNGGRVFKNTVITAIKQNSNQVLE